MHAERTFHSTTPVPAVDDVAHAADKHTRATDGSPPNPVRTDNSNERAIHTPRVDGQFSHESAESANSDDNTTYDANGHVVTSDDCTKVIYWQDIPDDKKKAYDIFTQILSVRNKTHYTQREVLPPQDDTNFPPDYLQSKDENKNDWIARLAKLRTNVDDMDDTPMSNDDAELALYASLMGQIVNSRRAGNQSLGQGLLKSNYEAVISGEKQPPSRAETKTWTPQGFNQRLSYAKLLSYTKATFEKFRDRTRRTNGRKFLQLWRFVTKRSIKEALDAEKMPVCWEKRVEQRLLKEHAIAQPTLDEPPLDSPRSNQSLHTSDDSIVEQPPASPDAMPTSRFMQGEHVMYKTCRHAQVLDVHWEDGAPPFYTLRMVQSRRELQTEEVNLSKPKADAQVTIDHGSGKSTTPDEADRALSVPGLDGSAERGLEPHPVSSADLHSSKERDTPAAPTGDRTASGERKLYHRDQRGRSFDEICADGASKAEALHGMATAKQQESTQRTHGQTPVKIEPSSELAVRTAVPLQSVCDVPTVPQTSHCSQDHHTRSGAHNSHGVESSAGHHHGGSGDASDHHGGRSNASSHEQRDYGPGGDHSYGHGYHARGSDHNNERHGGYGGGGHGYYHRHSEDRLPPNRTGGRDSFIKEQAFEDFVKIGDGEPVEKHRITPGFGASSFETLMKGLIQTSNGKAILRFGVWASYTFQDEKFAHELELLSSLLDDTAHGLNAFDGVLVDQLRALAAPNAFIGEHSEARPTNLTVDNIDLADPTDVEHVAGLRTFTGAVDVPSSRQSIIAHSSPSSKWPPTIPVGRSESSSGSHVLLHEMLRFLEKEIGQAYVAVTLDPMKVTKFTSEDFKPSSPWYYNYMTFKAWMDYDSYLAGLLVTMFDLESANMVPHPFFEQMLAVVRQSRNTHKFWSVLTIARQNLAPEQPRAEMFVGTITRFYNARYDSRQPLHHYIDYLRDLQSANHEHSRSISQLERKNFILITGDMIYTAVRQALLSLVGDGKQAPVEPYQLELYNVAKVLSHSIVGKRLTDDQKLTLSRTHTTVDLRQLSIEHHFEKYGNSNTSRPAKWVVRRDDPGGKPPLQTEARAMIHGDDDETELEDDGKPGAMCAHAMRAEGSAGNDDSNWDRFESSNGEQVLWIKQAGTQKPARAGDVGYFAPPVHRQQQQQQQSMRPYNAKQSGSARFQRPNTERGVRFTQTGPRRFQPTTQSEHQDRQISSSQKPLYRPMGEKSAEHAQQDQARRHGDSPASAAGARRRDDGNSGKATELQSEIERTTQHLRTLVRTRDASTIQKGAVEVLTALERLNTHQDNGDDNAAANGSAVAVDDDDAAAAMYEAVQLQNGYATEDALFRHADEVERTIPMVEHNMPIVASLHPDDGDYTEDISHTIERLHGSTDAAIPAFKTWADSGATNTVFTEDIANRLGVVIEVPFNIVVQTGSGVEGTKRMALTTLVRRQPNPDGRHSAHVVSGIVTPSSAGLSRKILLSERKMRSHGFDIIAPSDYDSKHRPTVVTSIFQGGDEPLMLHSIGGMQEADLVPLSMMPPGTHLTSMLDGANFDPAKAVRHLLHCAQLHGDRLLVSLDKALTQTSLDPLIDGTCKPSHVSVTSATPRYSIANSIDLRKSIYNLADCHDVRGDDVMRTDYGTRLTGECGNADRSDNARQAKATDAITGELSKPRQRGYIQVALGAFRKLLSKISSHSSVQAADDGHSGDPVTGEYPALHTHAVRADDDVGGDDDGGHEVTITDEPSLAGGGTSSDMTADVTSVGGHADSTRNKRQSQAQRWAHFANWKPLRTAALLVMTLCSGLATCGQVYSYGGVPVQYVGGCEINSRLRQRAERLYGGLNESDVRQLYRKVINGEVTLPDNIDVCEGTATCQTRCSLRYMQPISPKHQKTHGLFFIQMKLILKVNPKYIFLEITPPDAENVSDYRRVERTMRKGGYDVYTMNRMPSALCGDATCRHRYICVGVRHDVNDAAGINLSEYLSDVSEIRPMSDCLDEPEDVPSRLWLGTSEFMAKPSDFPSFDLPGIHDVVDYNTWGASTHANLVGWYGGYGKGRRVYDISTCVPTFTSYGNVLIYDDRVEPASVRYLTVREMARASNFDEELVGFLSNIPEQEAITYIANAVPIGLLSTVYAAIHDHSSTAWESWLDGGESKTTTNHNTNRTASRALIGEDKLYPLAEPRTFTVGGHASSAKLRNDDHSEHACSDTPTVTPDKTTCQDDESGADEGGTHDSTGSWGLVMGRDRTAARTSWGRMAKPGTAEYDNAVDRIVKLHNIAGHAPADRLEKIITTGITMCKPGDSRYLPPCNHCLTGGFDHVRRHHKSPSATREEMLRKYLPGEYYIFDVCEMPVYSVHGKFRYVFGATCPVSNYMVSYYSSDLTTATYIDFLKYLDDTSKQRCGRRVQTIYHDDFSTFHEYFDVTQAKSELGINSVTTPPYMHWLNGVAEVQFRWKVRTCRITLQHLVGARIRNVIIKDPQGYWPHAWDHAVDVYNVSPSSVNFRLYGHAYTPEQLFLNQPDKQTDWTQHHQFGDTVWYNVEHTDGKISPTAKKAYYLGRPSYSKLYAPFTDMPHGHAVLTEDNDVVRLTGKVRFASELTKIRGVRSVNVVGDGTTHSIDDTDGDDRSGVTDDGDADNGALAQHAARSGAEDSVRTDGDDDPGNDLDFVDRAGRLRSAGDTDSRIRHGSRNGAVVSANNEPSDAVTKGTDCAVGCATADDHDGRTANGAPVNVAMMPKSSALSALPPPNILRHSDFGIAFRADKHKDPTKNPKWSSYRTATTTRQYFELGGTAADWRYDLRQGTVWFVDDSLQALADSERRPARKSPNAQSIIGHKPSRADVNVQKAAYAEVLGITMSSVDDGGELTRDVWAMAHLYDELRNSSTAHMSPTVEDLSDTYMDQLLLLVEDDEYEEIVLQLVTPDMLTIDERQLFCLKGYDECMRKRMAAAVRKELVDLCKIGTWELCPLPSGQRAKGTKLICKVKQLADGSPDKDKGRLVVLGCQSQLGKDFFSTFSPMASLTSVRAVLALAAHYRLDVYQADIKQAFLRARLPHDSFVRLPKGVSIASNLDSSVSTDNGYVLRLLRSLYGLKEAPQIWNKELSRFAEDEGFVRADSETSLYYKINTDGSWCVVLAEVDDLLVTGTSTTTCAQFRTALVEKFSRIDVGGEKDDEAIAWHSISSFLGINITYDQKEGVMKLDVKGKIDELFVAHPIFAKLPHHANPWSSDLAKAKFDENAPLDEVEQHIREHYASLVGSLIYITITVRPDLSYVVGRMARGMHAPTVFHLKMMKRVMCYLQGHRDTGLTYRRAGNPTHDHLREMAKCDATVFGICTSFEDVYTDAELENIKIDFLTGFSDASFGDADNSRSTSGYCFFLFGNLISWKSKLQPLTAGSTHEAELIALGVAADEGVWLRRFLNEIHFAVTPEVHHIVYTSDDRDARRHMDVLAQPKSVVDEFVQDDEADHDKGALRMPPTPVFGDNLGTTVTVNNPVSAAWSSRHLDRRHFKVRDRIKEGKLRVTFVPTKANLADFFTKGLPTDAFKRFKHLIMSMVTWF